MHKAFDLLQFRTFRNGPLKLLHVLRIALNNSATSFRINDSNTKTHSAFSRAGLARFTAVPADTRLLL